MAALRGVMEYGHHAGTVSRLAHQQISAHLATWRTHVRAYVDRDGTVRVDVERDGKRIRTLTIKPEPKVRRVKKPEPTPAEDWRGVLGRAGVTP